MLDQCLLVICEISNSFDPHSQRLKRIVFRLAIEDALWAAYTSLPLCLRFHIPDPALYKFVKWAPVCTNTCDGKKHDRRQIFLCGPARPVLTRNKNDVNDSHECQRAAVDRQACLKVDVRNSGSSQVCPLQLLQKGKPLNSPQTWGQLARKSQTVSISRGLGRFLSYTKEVNEILYV